MKPPSSELGGNGRRAGFAARMAARELRAHPGALAFFSLCVALGVASLVGTESMGQALAGRLRAERRTLLGGDLEMLSRRPLERALRDEIEALRREGVEAAITVETLSMASRADGARTRLCTLKAVTSSYPLYGKLTSSPPDALSGMHRGEGVVIAPALGLQMEVSTGDVLKLGRMEFPIRGILEVEPDRLGEPFRLGPRLMMRLQDLEESGLLAKGSRATWRVLFRTPPKLDLRALSSRLKALSTDPNVEFTTGEQGPRSTRRFLRRVRLFLDLAGLAVLLLAGVGTGLAVRTFLNQRLHTIAILKCLGASGQLLVGLYLLHTLVLATAGSLAGALGGALLARGLPYLMSGIVPFALDAPLDLAVMGKGAAIGLFLTMGFCLPPLMDVRDVPALRVFRLGYAAEPTGTRFNLGRLLAKTALGVAVLYLTWVRAGKGMLAVIFLAGFFASLGVLALATRLLLAGVRRVPLPRSFALRQSLANLHRPGNQTGTVVVALGLGVFLLLSIHLITRSLLTELTTALPPGTANVFIIDIQTDQRDGVVQMLREQGTPATEVVPLVSARLAKIDGTSVSRLHPDPHKAPWWITRDYRLSYRDHLTSAEEILEGEMWNGPVPGPGTYVSVEESTARRLGVRLGSTLTVNVQGLEVAARVKSIRRVRWSSLRPNFFLLYPTGVLERAPQSWFAITHVDTAPARVETARRLVERYPNLTVIDLTMAVGMVGRFLDRVSWVIAAVGTLSLLCGLLVMAASIMMTRNQRVHEAALLKMLGARRGMLLRLLAYEYAAMGAFGGLIGALAAQVVAGIAADRVFELTLPFAWGPVLAAAATSTLLATLFGALSSAGILRPPPLQILRTE